MNESWGKVLIRNEIWFSKRNQCLGANNIVYMACSLCTVLDKYIYLFILFYLMGLI